MTGKLATCLNFLIAPADRPRGLPRRRVIISCACTCVGICARAIAGQYTGERGRKTHRERDLTVFESVKMVVSSDYDA